VELSWREQRPERPVESLVDVTLSERQALVRQQLRFLALPDTLKEVILRAPDLPANRTPLVDGQPLPARDPGVWLAPLKQPLLTLEYSLPLPEAEKKTHSRRFALPLFWAEGATRCLTKVRVWSDPGTQPALAGGPWEELPTEAVAEHDSLPALVLRSGAEAPLLLRLTESSGIPLASIVADRALIQAAVVEGEQQTYRARFLLSKLNSRHLDVEMPASIAALHLEVLLDGLRLTTVQVIDEDGSESETGRIARLRVEPELYRTPTVLELRYQIGPGRMDSQGRLQTTLYPPQLRGGVLLGRVRWLVSLPAEWVAYCPGSRVSVEQHWGLRGYLLGPKAAATALDLERWFNARADTEPEPAAAGGELVCAQAAPEPLMIWHVATQAWVLGCSLLFLALGLLLYFTGLPRGVFWAVILLLGLALLTTGLLWPSLLPLLAYGCEPGVVVLVVVIGAQWFMQRRYRRQVVFMPGFSRLAPGSSIVRTGSNHGSSHRRREPSTVDAPPAVGLKSPSSS
jgi:hypothetical protein